MEKNLTGQDWSYVLVLENLSATLICLLFQIIFHQLMTLGLMSELIKPEDIENGIQVLNPMITDPIMVGNFVIGDKRYLDIQKRKILNQPITEEAIRFSLREYRIELRRANDDSLGNYLQEKNLRSARIFLTNALNLKHGRKILSSYKLIDIGNHILSSNERFIELKGGVE